MNKRLILVGAGAFGRELISLAQDSELHGRGQKITAFLDDNPLSLDKFSYNLEYLGAIKDYKPSSDDELIVAISDPHAKQKIILMLKNKGANFGQLIHPLAVISNTAKLGEGVIVCAHTFVSADSIIGDFVVINVLSSIGHDTQIGSFCTLSAHVDLMGYVIVGKSVFFGSGARVLPRVKIGDEAIIGAGATVMRAVKAKDTMYTQPAKKL
jgi:sugar O-acyltransferase (sialic acid O-acetyltransferase NeuD family)